MPAAVATPLSQDGRAALPSDVSNTITVTSVCIDAAHGEQPVAHVYPSSDSSVRRLCRRQLHACMVAPYCRSGRASIYQFCNSLPANGSIGSIVLAQQAAHAFSEVRSVHNARYPPPGGVRRVKRAGLVGFTENVVHDLHINGGIMDLFAAQAARSVRGYFDALLLDVGDGFDRVISSRDDSLQLTILDGLFNRSGSQGFTTPLQPLRASTRLCIDELHWKPPVLDFNPLSRTLRYLRKARHHVLQRHNLLGSRSRRDRRQVVLYTRGDASRRRLVLDATSHSDLGSLNVTRVLTSMPSSPREQIALFASTNVWISAHGAHSANAFLLPGDAVYVELSPLCVELCINGCYPYASGGGSCAARGLIDGPMFASTTPSRACEDALNIHGGFTFLHAQALGIRAKWLFTCVGGNRCSEGKIWEGSHASRGKAAWKCAATRPVLWQALPSRP